MPNPTIRTLTFCAIGAALIAVLAQISIPLGPIPFTLQTLAIGLLASLLKPREAILAIFIYLLLGGLGLPIFAGGNGGFQALLGPGSGFLWGFLFYAGVTSALTFTKSPRWQIFLANLIGDSLVFLLGTLVYAFHLKMSLLSAATAVVLPFILGDLLKVSLITLFTPLIRKALAPLAYFKS